MVKTGPLLILRGQFGTKGRSIRHPDASPKLMSINILAPIAALLYLAATGLQLWHIIQQRPQLDRTVASLGLLALLCHAVVAWGSVFREDGMQLGFYKISALIFLVINVTCILSLARRPLQNLLVVLFPLSAMSVLVSTYAPDTSNISTNLPGGMLAHIASSVLAYAVLTLAAAQAALVAAQDYQLRHRHTRYAAHPIRKLFLRNVIRLLFKVARFFQPAGRSLADVRTLARIRNQLAQSCQTWSKCSFKFRRFIRLGCNHD